MWVVRGVKLMTVSEFAESVGVTRQGVHYWIKKGLPVCVSEGMYLVYYDRAVRWLNKRKSYKGGK